MLKVIAQKKLEQYQLEDKMDVGEKDSAGRTPLHYHHNILAIETLLKHGARIVKSKAGLTPLDEIRQIEPNILITEANKEKMIELLSVHLEIQKQREQQEAAFIFGLFDRGQRDDTPKTSLKIFSEDELFDKTLVKEIFKLM